MAKPFVKWAGGKGKLLRTLDQYLPVDFADQQAITYIEPFVGGGAMLFHMLQAHPNINRVIINDINPELMNCYNQIKHEPQNMIEALHDMEQEFYQNTTHEERQAFFYAIREEFNQLKHVADPDVFIEVRKASCFLFLNRTCFNGLYRENHQGNFNVPFGRYAHPKICNEELLMECHHALQNVEMLCGDYHDIFGHINQADYNFFYFDPPYRPLLGANNFKDYTQFEFEDQQQFELRDFCNQINDMGAMFMLSNSDSEIEPGVNFFEQAYAGFNFHHVMAPRVINAFAAARVPQSEVLITNYNEVEHA